MDRKMYQWAEIFQSSRRSIIDEDCARQLTILQMLDNDE
jgi:hypothetical protein